MAIPALKQPVPPNIRFWLAGIITITFIAALAVLSIFIWTGENTDLVTVPTLVGPPVAWAKSDPNTKIEDRFKVSFVKNQYAKIYPEKAIETLRLNGTGILDPNLVLGISPVGIITRFENDKGEIVDVPDQTQPTSMPQRETPDIASSRIIGVKSQELRNRYRTIPNRDESSVLSKWANRMTLELEPGLLVPEPENINRVKGHFYVLMAKSLEYIEIPFEPNETWVQLAPGFEIKVLEAKYTGESNHEFQIETRQEVQLAPGLIKVLEAKYTKSNHGFQSIETSIETYLLEGRAFTGSIHPWSDLPNRFPIDNQWLDKDGKLVHRLNHRFSSPIGGLIGGFRGMGGSSVGRIEKIRFVIAVNASHHKIPFELEDIPLSLRNLIYKKMFFEFEGQPLPDYHPDIEKNDIWKRQPKPFEKIVSWKLQPLPNFRYGSG
jgi:hypothetical protein